MNNIKSIQVLLQGKKTYIVTTLAAIYVGGSYLHWWTFNVQILALFGFSSVATLAAKIERLLSDDSDSVASKPGIPPASILILCAMLFSFSAQAQTNSTTVTDLIGKSGEGITQVGKDAVNVFAKLSLTNPISVGVFGVKNGKNYGGGIDVCAANPDSLVNVGFAVLALPNNNHRIDFYDATINLSISTTEIIPVVNIPILLKIESGPAFRLSRGGNTLLEQSAVFGDLTFDWIAKWPITAGGGVIHCSVFGGALPMAHLNITHTF